MPYLNMVCKHHSSGSFTPGQARGTLPDGHIDGNGVGTLQDTMQEFLHYSMYGGIFLATSHFTNEIPTFVNMLEEEGYSVKRMGQDCSFL